MRINQAYQNQRIWYKCLVCHRCFQYPQNLLAHRAESECRFEYEEIIKERSARDTIPLVDLTDEIPNLDNEVLIQPTQPDDDLIEENNLINQAPADISETEGSEKPSKEAEIVVLDEEEDSNDYISEFIEYLNKSGYSETERQQSNIKETELINSTQSQPIVPAKRVSPQRKCNERGSVNLVHKWSVPSLPRLQRNRCYFCGKHMKIFSHLTRHMSTHTNEEGYLCTMCRMTFKRKESLRSHTTRFHTLPATSLSQTHKRNQCQTCLRCLSSPRSLRRHLKDIHKLTP